MAEITISSPDPDKPAQVGESTMILLTIGKNAGTGPLNVSVKSQLTPKPLDVRDNQDQTMSIVFTPRATGRHEFELEWADVPIPGSPVVIEVTGTVKRRTSIITVEGEGLKGGKVNEVAAFKVKVPEEAGPGPLKVDAAGPVEPVIDLKNIGPGEFSVALTVSKAGNYNVAVCWGDEDHPIPGSPFIIKIE